MTEINAIEFSHKLFERIIEWDKFYFEAAKQHMNEKKEKEQLKKQEVVYLPGSALCVVMNSKKFPEKYDEVPENIKKIILEECVALSDFFVWLLNEQDERNQLFLLAKKLGSRFECVALQALSTAAYENLFVAPKYDDMQPINIIMLKAIQEMSNLSESN